MTAGFRFYRAFAQDAEDNKAFIARGKLNMPVLGLSAGALAPMPYVYEMLKPLGTNVEGHAIEGAGHWLAEERPDEVVQSLVKHLGRLTKP